ncbi:MAG TPA: protein kinase [Pyrinomonadaceae bacterium]|nr:protein kinase [Pyrinomonadaceae bacterium]
MVGNTIGSYRIERKLGEGGMGAVYMGTDMMLEREVAIKALRPDLASQPPVVERFRSEAVTLAKLNHPNIATLYSFFRQGDEFFMVLEYVRGVTLHQLITSQGALPPEQALRLFRQMLDGIHHAHNSGIIHRDIKPGNVMLTENGTLKVLDFGIARILGAARMTKAGHLVGTVEYMSPEQVRGLEMDARSDIYALGVLLYEMLTGRVPFLIENEFELMKAQIEQQPPPPRELNPAIPPEVEAVILRALAKDPNERYQTAGEFRAALPDTGLAPSAALDVTMPSIAANSYATSELINSAAANTSPILNAPPATPSPATDHLSKETRLNAPSQPVVPPAASLEMPPATPGSPKETRLLSDRKSFTGADTASDAAPKETPPTNEPRSAEIPVVPPPPSLPAAASPLAAHQPQPSFFARLTWVHYAVIGLVVLFMLGVGIAVPLALWAASGGGAAVAEDAPAATPAATEAPVVEATTPEPSPSTTTEEIAQPEPTAEAAGGEATNTMTPTPETPPTEESAESVEAATPAAPGVRSSPRAAAKATPASTTLATSPTPASGRERTPQPKATKAGPSSRRDDLKKALTEAP